MRLKKQYLIIFSLFLQCNLWGQSKESTHHLADRMYAQNQFEEALYLYQRVAYFSKPQADANVLGRIADCFYAQADFTRAIEYYDHAYFATSDTQEKTNYLFGKMGTYLEIKNYHFVLVELLGEDFPTNIQNHYSKELYLAAAYFGLEQFEDAGKHFVEAIPAERKEARQQIESIFNEPKNFSRPKPKVAFILSAILPGAGQVYAGNPGAGINSLILTGSFVGLVLYLSVRINPIDAILTGLPWFQRYYQGGFDQAEISAEHARELRRNKHYQEALQIIGSSL